MSAPGSAVKRRPALRTTSCEFVQILMKLQRAAQLVTATLDLDEMLEHVVKDLTESIGCLEVSVWLRDGHSEEMVLRGVRGCSQNAKGCRLKIGRGGIVGHVAATGKMRYAPDVRVDPYYIRCEPETRSSVGIPLKVRGETIGVFCVDHAETGALSHEQLQILQALASHITVAVENARAFQKERSEREAMRREAEDARIIQQALFPKAFPLIAGFSFEAEWCPAGLVGGDWFDFIDLGNDRHGIVLADVSGKGMPAALLMSAARAVLRTVVRIYDSPAEVLHHLSRTLSDDFPMGKFVTMIYGVLDAPSRTFTFASAGHPRPLLINGDCAYLDIDTGLPLGFGVSEYPEHTVKLRVGERLLLYSDGITEAMNREYEEYGPERLIDHFLQPGGCAESLLEHVRAFELGSDTADDATVVVINSR